MSTYLHLCNECARFKECPVGIQVSEGIWDQYVKDEILEELDDQLDFSLAVVVYECRDYESVKGGQS